MENEKYTVQWVRTSEYSGLITNQSKKHYKKNWRSERTICGVLIPEHNDYTITVDISFNDNWCDRCIRIIDTANDHAMVQEGIEQTILENFPLTDGATINKTEIQLAIPGVTWKKLQDAILRVGYKSIQNSECYYPTR